MRPRHPRSAAGRILNMNPFRPPFLALLSTVAGSTLHCASPSVDPAVIYPAWTGQWQGVLEYRDYRPPHGRVCG